MSVCILPVLFRMSRTAPSFTKMYPNKDFTDVVENNYTVALWVPGHYQVGRQCVLMPSCA